MATDRLTLQIELVCDVNVDRRLEAGAHQGIGVDDRGSKARGIADKNRERTVIGMIVVRRVRDDEIGGEVEEDRFDLCGRFTVARQLAVDAIEEYRLDAKKRCGCRGLRMAFAAKPLRQRCAAFRAIGRNDPSYLGAACFRDCQRSEEEYFNVVGMRAEAKDAH